MPVRISYLVLRAGNESGSVRARLIRRFFKKDLSAIRRRICTRLAALNLACDPTGVAQILVVSDAMYVPASVNISRMSVVIRKIRKNLGTHERTPVARAHWRGVRVRSRFLHAQNRLHS